MKEYRFSMRTGFFLALLGICVMSLFAVSARHRSPKEREERDTSTSSMCSCSSYDRNRGVTVSLSSTTRLPLRELLEAKISQVAVVRDEAECNCNVDAEEAHLYWHTTQGDEVCLFEQERILVCLNCGMIQERHPTTNATHKKGDASLPGYCME